MPQKKTQAKINAQDKDIFEKFKTYVEAVKKETEKAFPTGPPSYTISVSNIQMPILMELLRNPNKFT